MGAFLIGGFLAGFLCASRLAMIDSNFDRCHLNILFLHIICQVFLAVLLCEILESRWVFKNVHRYNVLINHSCSPGESVRALTVLTDVWHVNRGSPLSFPVCSNKIFKVGEIQRDFVGVFNKTIIPLALVGYEMIIANSALRASLALYHLISNAPSWNNC